jgi:hypothetical protein
VGLRLFVVENSAILVLLLNGRKPDGYRHLLADHYGAAVPAVAPCSLARRDHTQLDRSSAATLRRRLLKPHKPDGCPAYCCEPRRFPVGPAQPPAVRPWREVKSRRGAPKRITFGGFACPKPACANFRIAASFMTFPRAARSFQEGFAMAARTRRFTGELPANRLVDCSFTEQSSSIGG